MWSPSSFGRTSCVHTYVSTLMAVKALSPAIYCSYHPSSVQIQPLSFTSILILELAPRCFGEAPTYYYVPIGRALLAQIRIFGQTCYKNIFIAAGVVSSSRALSGRLLRGRRGLGEQCPVLHRPGRPHVVVVEADIKQPVF